MPPFSLRTSIAVLALGAAFGCGGAAADEAQIQRGKYLVSIAGCSDCHTPGGLLGKPDMSRYLGGSDTGFAIPGAGVFVGQNVTPDRETGIGDWSSADIVKALRTGKQPNGAALSGVMPVFAQLADPDAEAIAAFLKSLPPVKNKVPGPIKPGNPVNVFVSVVLAADVYNGLQGQK